MPVFKMRATIGAAAVAIATCFAIPGAALAQQQQPTEPEGECSTEAPTSFNVEEWRGTISAEDRDAVLDVLHGLAWTLDLQLAPNFADLTTEDVVYEACTGGGFQITITETQTNLINYFEAQPFAFLTEQSLRARHFLANTVLRATDKDDEVEAHTAMLVTLQRSDVEVPSVDYTATLVAILTTREDGVYRISELTMYTDEPETIFRAR